MGKRGSNQTPASKAKATKVAASPSKAKALPFQPELELLKVAELPASCRQMLVAMLPNCLCTPEAERHEAQKAVADTFDKIFAGLESSKQSAVAAAQAALRSSDAELAPLVSKMDAAQAVLDKMSAAAAEADKAQESGPTTEVVAEAKKVLEAAKKHQGGLAGERDVAEARKTEITEKLENVWKPLKGGSVTPPSKIQKELRVISEVFKKHCGAEESFLVGLSAALSRDVLKGVTASAFSVKVIQYGDDILQRKIQDCTGRIDGFEGKTAEAARSVASAEAKLGEALAAHDVVVTADIGAQNQLANAQEHLNDAKDEAESAKLKVSQCTAELAAAEEKLKATRELIAARGHQEEAAAAEPAEAE